MSFLQELAEASGSNKLSDQMILYFEREIAEDQKSIEDFTEMCKMLTNQVWNRPELPVPASEEGLAFLRVLQKHDLKKAKTIMVFMQMINEIEADIRRKTAFIEKHRHM